MLKLTALNEIIVVTCVAVILGLVHMFCAQFVSLRHGGSFFDLAALQSRHPRGTARSSPESARIRWRSGGRDCWSEVVIVVARVECYDAYFCPVNQLNEPQGGSPVPLKQCGYVN